ncbi:MAG: hypothetical protein ACRD88_18110, partial [Terriglobia bacterium]
ADWKPQAAAEYLDSRQKDWFAWPTANKHGTPCLSCHTGLPYLLSRPALRRALSESGPTEYESGLLSALRSRVARKTAKELYPEDKGTHAAQATGVETVLAALLLAKADAGRLSAETQEAFDRLWRLQLKEGPAKGAWDWFALDLDPWETADSIYFGASLAALAVGSTPASYQARPEVREGVAALTDYLRGARPGQPLHNRIALLWASTKLPAALSKADRRALLEEIARKQHADGGWTMESLGAFANHPKAPPPGSGSNSYATAFTAFAMRQAGVGAREPSLARALAWLRARQDPLTGVWTASSMNKLYEPGSNQIRFMQDAATGYAVLALLGPDKK